MKLLLLLVFLLPISLVGQSLVANGGFEQLNVCEEYGAKCAPEAWFRIPPTEVNVNTKKIPRVYEGRSSEIVVIENELNPVIYRLFLYTKLLCPLEKDKVYTLSFYLNPITHKKYSLGALFSKQELISGLINPMDYTPSLVINEKNEAKRNKKTNWRKIELNYRARGGEQYLTFGNFSQQAVEFWGKHTQANNPQGDLVYLLDKVEMTTEESSEAIPCADYGKNKQLLYATNHRHTNKKGIRESLVVTKIAKVEQTLVKKTPVLPESKPKEVQKFEIPNVAFDFDSAVIRSDFFGKLDSLISRIKALNPKEIEMTGYTDDIGTTAYNLELSTKRAEAVKAYFEENYNAITGKIRTQGKGEEHPKVANDSEENRAMNRRVEIVIF